MTREYQSFESIRALTNHLVEQWKQGTEPNAALALLEHPELQLNKDAALELALEEILLRQASGEEVDIEEYIARFPCYAYASSLRHMLSIYKFIGDHPEKLIDIPFFPLPEAGEKLDVFRMIRVLGEGAFATVYLAEETSTGGRPVVVKLSRQASREPHTLGQLPHPGIIPILSAREDAETGFQILCMPWYGCATLQKVGEQLFPLEGHSPPSYGQDILDGIERCRHADDPIAREHRAGPDLAGASYEEGICRLGSLLAGTLRFLHEHKVFHSDLKPANVLLTASGAPLLLDFNLSGHQDELEFQVGGTVPWLAPERLEAWLKSAPAAREAAAPADIYSLGVMLYELLTGYHPLGQIPTKLLSPDLGHLLLDRSREGGCRPLRERNPNIDEDRANLIDRCLALNPRQRPTAAELVEGLCPRPVILPGLGDEGPELAEAVRIERAKRRWSSRLLVPIVGVGLILGMGMWAVSQTLWMLPPGPGSGKEARTLTELAHAIEEATIRRDSGDGLAARNRFEKILLDLDVQIEQSEAAGKLLETEGGRDLQGRILVLLGKDAQAERCFDQADRVAQRRPGKASNGMRHAYVAWTLAAGRHHAQAVTRADTALKSGVRSPGLFNNKGYSLSQLGKLDLAWPSLVKARELAPKEPTILVNQSRWAFQNWGRNQGAPARKAILHSAVWGWAGPRSTVADSCFALWVATAPTNHMPARVARDIEEAILLFGHPRARQFPELYLLSAQIYAARSLDLQRETPGPVQPHQQELDLNLDRTYRYIQLAWRAGMKPEEMERRDPFLKKAIEPGKISDYCTGRQEDSSPADPRELYLMDPTRPGRD